VDDTPHFVIGDRVGLASWQRAIRGRGGGDIAGLAADADAESITIGGVEYFEEGDGAEYLEWAQDEEMHEVRERAPSSPRHLLIYIA
jgi:hypothetical protein